jgi:FkbM family methyltransferase
VLPLCTLSDGTGSPDMIHQYKARYVINLRWHQDLFEAWPTWLRKTAVNPENMPPVLDLLPYLAAEDGCAVVSGSNLLPWIAPLAKNLAQLHVFEPDPVKFAQLKRTAAANVSLYAMALSATVGLTQCYVHQSDGSQLSRQLSLTPGDGESTENCFEVEAVALDSIPLDKLSLIVHDFPGAENAFLLGAADTIRDHRPAALLRFREDDQESRRQALDFFSDCNYQPLTIDKGTLTLRPAVPTAFADAGHIVFLPTQS